MVGAYFGNPELGFALGSLAGSVLFPTQLPSGPQLTDNRTTTASLGEPTPIVFGTASVAGTVIWLGPIITSTTEQGGKGGPEQKLYNYNQSIAIGLCESAVDLETAIGGMTRVWENGTIVYDIRPQQAANTETGQVAETDEQYASRLTASANYAEGFTLYLGSETQTPDPTIESIEGMGNVQPFLGLAYIVYPNRLLETSQGWRHPNFQFELFQSGTGECITVTETSQSVLFAWIDEGAFVDPTNTDNSMTWKIIDADPFAPNYPSHVGTTYNSFEDMIAAGADLYGFGMDQFVGYGVESYSGTGSVVATVFCGGNSVSDLPHARSIQAHFNWTAPGSGNSFCNDICNPGPGYNSSGYTFWNGDGVFRTSAFPPGSSPSTPANFLSQTIFNCGGTQAPTNILFATQDITIQVARLPSAPLSPCFGKPPAANPDYCVLDDGRWALASSEWVLVPNPHDYYLLQNYTNPGANEDNPAVGPTMLIGSAGDTEANWVAAYNAAVARGDMAPGLVYSPNGGLGSYPTLANEVYSLDFTTCTGAGDEAKLSDIIRAVCGRAGVTDIDVTDMEVISVDGYPISSLSSAAAILDPLKSVGFYDAVESGLTIRFQSRGKEIVATLTADDIGAYDSGSSGANCPPSVSVVRALDSDLPRRIRYHYNSVQRDYQPGEQDSPFRPTSIAVNDQDVSIPVAMGDTQALQAAEILWADAWNGRTTYSIAIDQEWSELEGGDAIAIPVDGFTERVRIIKDQNSGGVLRKLTCVSDDARSYSSVAIAPPSSFQPPKLTLLAQTLLFLLDIPALQDADATAGFYTSVSRLWSSGNAFKGAQIYKSTDGGSTFSGQYAQTGESIYATIAGTVPVSSYYTWDNVTVIEVVLPDDSLSFQSMTDDAVLAGANAAAIGADGRWEIIQFATATKIAAKTWNLSRLLRGRRGTEHVIGTSQASDQLIMLQSGTLARISLNTSEIGNLDDYKAVSIGASFNSGTVEPFTSRAVALLPFSPVHIHAKFETDGDILIDWVRRDKLGRTLMSGVDIPNSESILAFQIDIVALTPDSPETVIRTLSVSNATEAIYSAAEIATDFGSTPPTSLRVYIYQMSAVVGRGTPGHKVINLLEESS